MDDYISRKALVEHIKAHCGGCDNCGEVMHCAWDTPAADVEPVRHGHWIKRGYVCGEKMTAMPMCGECSYGNGEWKDDGICYACREQVWIPGRPHRKAGEED